MVKAQTVDLDMSNTQTALIQPRLLAANTLREKLYNKLQKLFLFSFLGKKNFPALNKINPLQIFFKIFLSAAHARSRAGAARVGEGGCWVSTTRLRTG